MERIQVVIADDHPLVRCGTRETLRAADDIVLVGEASRGDEAQRLCQELQPDVLLLDLQMPGATAVETMTDVRARCPQTRIIILTAYDDEVYVRRMIAEGAVGYVLKDEASEVLPTAIRSVTQNGIWLSHRVLDALATRQPSNRSGMGEIILGQEGNEEEARRAEYWMTLAHIQSRISEREWEVLQLLADDLTYEEIGNKIYASEGTIKAHVSSIGDKLGLEQRGRRSVVAEARNRGWL